MKAFDDKQEEYMKKIGICTEPGSMDLAELEEVIAARLQEKGFNADYEPTEEGRMCESILDRMGEL